MRMRPIAIYFPCVDVISARLLYIFYHSPAEAVATSFHRKGPTNLVPFLRCKFCGLQRPLAPADDNFLPYGLNMATISYTSTTALVI